MGVDNTFRLRRPVVPTGLNKIYLINSQKREPEGRPSPSGSGRREGIIKASFARSCQVGLSFMGNLFNSNDLRDHRVVYGSHHRALYGNFGKP